MNEVKIAIAKLLSRNASDALAAFDEGDAAKFQAAIACAKFHLGILQSFEEIEQVG